ncbi:MAG TPA: transcription termination factor Rho [Acidimicrobiales bacterium]|nr:transcription termination factor Rho [Acidimicrobiales bacterium]
MSGEQQLERSVLERKERDELHTIAEAMSLKPGARTKKADIIDQILRATGIEVSGSEDTAGGTAAAAPDRPRRARATRSRTVADQAGSQPVQATPLIDEAPGDSGGGSGDGQLAVAGDAAAGETGDQQASSNGSVAAGDQAERAHEPADRPAGQGDAGGGGTSEAAGAAEVEGSSSSGTGESGAARSTAEAARATPEPSADTAPDPTSGRDAPTTASETDDTEVQATAGGEPSEGGDGGGETGGASGSGEDARRDGGRAESGQRKGNGQQGGQSGGRNAGAGQSRQSGGQAGGQGSHGDGAAETGNRRSRRRRGRGGGGDRSERDVQGGGQEPQFQGEPIPVKGLLDLRDEGYGFLRASGYLPSPKDVYVSVSQARRFGLRKGDHVEGGSRPANSNEKYPALVRVDTVNGVAPDESRQRAKFEDLTPLFPDERLKLEIPGDAANMCARIVDLLSPIGKGQRGLIVSPPKAGKTTVLKQIAHSIEANNPEVHLMVLLVDERPEEVTDMRRSVKGEVVASTFDRPADEHTAVAELTMERAKRLVEQGQDVVIVLDGITRLARAYNLAQPATGRIMSGGVDSGALYPPKKFFGSARNIEEGGSLTILATALVETGSRMDEVIFEEFKGTGNMELRLDRRLAERRIYPAIEVNASSTRHEELLFDRSQLQLVWKLRRVLNALASDGNAAPGLELLMDKIKTTKGNDEFLAEIAKAPAPAA